MSKSYELKGDENSSDLQGESDNDKSFVRKVKSRVSGLLPTTLSRWFNNNASVRQRDEEEEDDEESFNLQPPMKRAKYPTGNTLTRNDFELNFVSTTPASSLDQPGPSGLQQATRKQQFTNGLVNVDVVAAVDAANKDNSDDSGGESTSGYSSMPRIGSKEQVSDVLLLLDKNSSSSSPTNHKTLCTNRSLFNTSASQERSLFIEQNNASLSSRRPSFSSSAFGSPNFMDRTLSTKRIVNSPFYSGRTTYGGASAYSNRNVLRFPEIQPTLQSFIEPKGMANVEGNKHVTLSKTAKRILDTLEQYTTPCADIKKIPNPSKRQCNTNDGLIGKYRRTASPYLMRTHADTTTSSKTASNRELNVPTMSDLLKMKLKERLQDSTVSVRELATHSKCPLNNEEYKLRRNVDEVDEVMKKSRNKIKTKIGVGVRQRSAPDPTQETMEPLILPEIKLPISSMPSFDFSIPCAPPPPPPQLTKQQHEKEVEVEKSTLSTTTTIPFVATAKDTPKMAIDKKVAVAPNTTTTTTTTTNLHINNNNQTDKLKKDSIEFKFAMPLVLADNVNSIIAINNFKFSEPINKKVLMKAAAAANEKLAAKNNSIDSFFNTTTTTTNNNKQKSIVNFDIKKNDLTHMFKPEEGSWECGVCMLRNMKDKLKCVACETARKVESLSSASASIPAATATSSSSSSSTSATTGSLLFDQFKMSADKWECSICLIRNDKASSKCAACETPRASSSSAASAVAPKAAAASFGAQFMKSDKQWECPTCMLRNGMERMSCVACTAPKPTTTAAPTTNNTTAKNTFGNKFKPAISTWECSVCLIRNDNANSKCVACENAKPGAAAPSSSAPPPPSAAAAAQSKGFGSLLSNAKKDQWECSSCMVKNGNHLMKCQCCESPKPGALSTPISKSTTLFLNDTGMNAAANVPKFNFGIDKAQLNGYGFAHHTTTPTTTPTTKSPIHKLKETTTTTTTLDKTANSNVAAAPVQGFVFGVAPIPNGTNKSVQQEKTADTNVTFKFGMPPAATAATPPAVVVTPANKVNNEVKAATLNVLPLNGDVQKVTTTPTHTNFAFDSSKTIDKPIAKAITSPIQSPPQYNMLFGADAAAKKPAENTTATATTTTTVPNIFGSSSRFGGIASTSSKPTFNATTTPQPSTAATSTTTTNQLKPSSGFGFSATTSSTHQQMPTFNFAAAKPAAAATSTNPTPPPPHPTFGSINSSASTTTTAAATMPFGGGGASSFIKPASTNNTNQTTTAAATTTPTLFNNNSSQPQQQQQTKELFTFGSISASSKSGGFNFGQTTATNTPPPPAAANTGGFKFGSSTMMNAPNNNTPPTFNFGAPTGNFATQQTPQNGNNNKQARRVIRRAFRRTQR